MHLAHAHLEDFGIVANFDIPIGAQVIDPDRVLLAATVGADEHVTVVDLDPHHRDFAHPTGLVAGVGDRYLGADDYWLNTGQLICIGPGESPQMLHRDELNWPHAMRADEITVTAIFALTDFTESNGATLIAPGSNHWEGALPPVPEETLCRATMPAGSALLYSGKVIHGGGANVTDDQWRVGLHAGFCRGWLRAEENFQLTVPLDIARTLPDRARYLLGFRSYSPEFGGRLGLVDYDDAARLLE